MFKNYLKITFRSLWKSKVFVIINILGMGIAISCCIVGYLNYEYSSNFDSNQAHVDNVYRVASERVYRGDNQLFGITPIPLGEAVKNNIGEVDDVMRFMPTGQNIKVETEMFNENFVFVDHSFFDFFDFEITKGSKESLEKLKTVIISEKMVEKYFLDKDPIGQTVTILTDSGPYEFEVGGVFKNPQSNSSFMNVQHITLIDNYFSIQNQNLKEGDKKIEENWGAWITLFVRVNNPNQVDVIENRLTDNYIQIQNNARLDFKLEKYVLEPFEGMALRAGDDQVYSHWLVSTPPPPAIYVPAIMSILILLIACFNFTNTSMAIAGKRLKEIGLRKVMGGLRSQLVFQFLLENIVLCFLSLLAGVILGLFLVPAYSEMWQFLDLQLDFTGNIGFYLFLSAVLLFTGLVAGSYPAFYISKFEPAAILKGSSKYGKTGWVSNTLLTIQFTISLLAIIIGVIFYQNAIFQKEMDYGYDQTGNISLYFDEIDDLRAFENRIAQYPLINKVASSEHQINRGYRNDPIKNQDKEYDVDILHTGENYFETMEFSLLEGRKFIPDSETDINESVIVSEEMVKIFEWKEPIGQKLVWMDTVSLYVIGVMKDVYINGLWQPLSPVALRYSPEEKYHYFTVNTDVARIVEVNDDLKGEWSAMFPDKMYTGQFMNDQLSDSVLINENILKMFGFLGVIATFMSVIGLFSIVSLTLIKRMKEIGVRKVLGASISHLMFILNKNFIIILLIASVLGSVLSYFLADGLMGVIWEYHIDPQAMSFVFSIGLLFFISLVTISIKVFKAASTNPTETIRSE